MQNHTTRQEKQGKTKLRGKKTIQSHTTRQKKNEKPHRNATVKTKDRKNHHNETISQSKKRYPSCPVHFYLKAQPRNLSLPGGAYDFKSSHNSIREGAGEYFHFLRS